MSAASRVIYLFSVSGWVHIVGPRWGPQPVLGDLIAISWRSGALVFFLCLTVHPYVGLSHLELPVPE